MSNVRDRLTDAERALYDQQHRNDYEKHKRMLLSAKLDLQTAQQRVAFYERAVQKDIEDAKRNGVEL